jgi:hypothetical protein
LTSARLAAASSALAAARAASSWTWAGAASLIAIWTAELIPTVGGVTSRLTLIKPVLSMASNPSQAHFESAAVEDGVAALRYWATTRVPKSRWRIRRISDGSLWCYPSPTMLARL